MSAPFTVGARFPDLALTDRHGQGVRLRTLTEGQPTVVYFLRSAACPVCRAHLRTLVRRLREISALGARVVAVVPEDATAARALGQWVADAVPVVSGGREGHAQAGLEPALFGRLTSSGTVLLDRDGTVRYARRAALPPLSFSERELFEALSAGQHRAA